MQLYENILKERTLKSEDSKNNLLDLESSRAYQLRISKLRAEVQDFDSMISNLDIKVGDTESNYKTKVILDY